MKLIPKEEMSGELEMKQDVNDVVVQRISWTTSAFLILVVLSFRQFFFFVPNFSRPEVVIAVVQIFYAFGWILLIFVTPLLLFRARLGEKSFSALFLLSVLLWPISTVTIKLLNWYYFGKPNVEYWLAYPVFIFMEVVVPIGYLLYWVKSKVK